MRDKLTIKIHACFEEALKVLDSGGVGFLAVVDDNEKLFGILTDGDVRRAILNKKNKLEDAVNKAPVTLNAKASRKQAVQYLKSIHRRHLPIVDDENNLVDVLVLDDLEFNAKPNKIVVMAGGYGTRLGNLTKDVPKPMLPLGNKPVLEHIIGHCCDNGFNNICISVNYKSEVIKSYFKDGANFGASITYIEEKQKLGTAGSLSLIDNLNEPFVVVNGDVLTTLDISDLLECHVKGGAFATMCVKEINYDIPYGVINMDETMQRIVSIQEKPTNKVHINAGIYILNPEVVNFIPDKQYIDMTTLFQVLMKNHKIVQPYLINDYWLDIGAPRDYDLAKQSWLSF